MHNANQCAVEALVEDLEAEDPLGTSHSLCIWLAKGAILR